MLTLVVIGAWVGYLILAWIMVRYCQREDRSTHSNAADGSSTTQ